MFFFLPQTPTPLWLPAIHPRPAAAWGGNGAATRRQRGATGGLSGYAAPRGATEGLSGHPHHIKPLRRFKSLSVYHDSHEVRIRFAAFDLRIPRVVSDE